MKKRNWTPTSSPKHWRSIGMRDKVTRVDGESIVALEVYLLILTLAVSMGCLGLLFCCGNYLLVATRSSAMVGGSKNP